MAAPSTTPLTSAAPARDEAYALDVPDDGSQVFIAGTTSSATLPSGTTADYDADLNGTFDGFVAVFNPTLATLQYFTYIGTDNNGDPDGDRDRWATTTGRTSSPSAPPAPTTSPSAAPSAVRSGPPPATPTTAPARTPSRSTSPRPRRTALARATADITDGAASDVFMYLARFTGFTTLTYGTYVDQDEDIQLNDMILLGDGRIAFSGAADCGDDDDCTDNDSTPLVNDFAVNGGAVDRR